MIVLDASFLVAFHNDRDVHHARAVKIMERILSGEWGSPLLPEYVFLEVVTVLRTRLDLAAALRVADTLLAAREVAFVPCSEVFLDALAIFRNEAEHSLSFADAAVAAVARRHPPGAVATFDTDFRGLAGVTVVA